MDDLDKRILTLIQANLPVTERPFEALAEQVNVPPEGLLSRLRRLAAEGIIRRVGPVFDSRALGYVSTLIAARVRADHLEEVADRISLLPGVTHNYERDGRYNLWFTLTAPSEGDLEAALERLRTETGIIAMRPLPALARYKIRATFDLTGRNGGPIPPAAAPHCGAPSTTTLNENQKALVRAVQDGLPITPEPFATVAESAGWAVPDVLCQIRTWLEEGVVRRFGAVVGHRAAGIQANGMAVFRISEKHIAEAGRTLATHGDVTHCYRRPPLPDFPYSLYAMVHGVSEETVRQRVKEMARLVGAEGWNVLFSRREFKKTGMRYFRDPRAHSP